MPIKYFRGFKKKEDITTARGVRNNKLKYILSKINWRMIFSWFVIAGLLFSIFFVGYVAMISRDLPKSDGLLTRLVPESTKLYDRSGKHILHQIHGDERRTAIEISELPKHVPNAFIAIEDKDFYKHEGIIWKRFVKAVYDDVMYVMKKLFIPGFIREFAGIKLNKVQGASTITQQLVKNVILTPEKTINRKLKEMILAWQLERRFTKDQILKMYLNEISYGGVNYGLESAAQSYFKKPAKELTVAESATLAALINSPTRLSPYGNHKDELILRQRFVLSLMFNQGLITQSEYDMAKAQELVFNDLKTGSIIAPHFVMYVRQLLEEDLGAEESERLLKEGGLHVYTTLDLDLQKIAEDEISNARPNLTVNKADNASLVALDPKTGDILAMVGSVDYYDVKNEGNFNVATSGLRQPGSSIKPLIYAGAFQKGYSPETTVYDVETNFDLTGSNPYIPRNYDSRENGLVSLRKALAGSLNIPAVKLLYLVGIDDVKKLARSMGYTTLENGDYGLSLVLGGAEVTLLEHTTAYGAFANEGLWSPHRAVLRIEDRAGKIIKSYDQPQPIRVFDANATRMLSSILSDNSARSYIFGNNNIFMIKNYVVAGKSGTTNDYRDAWLMGYTPNLVVGVWAGNNNNKSMKAGSGGSKVAGPIWNGFLSKVLAQHVEFSGNFLPYPTNAVENPALNGSLAEGVKVKVDSKTGKLATDYTPEHLIEERVYQDPHSILHYVDRLNPFGDKPRDPFLDGQYLNWENAIQNWVVRYNEKAVREGGKILELIKPPQEYDDVHIPENRPSVSILEPSFGARFSSDIMKIRVEASASRGVSYVDYFIDDRRVGGSVTWPYEILYNIRGLQNGAHFLTVKACDDVENCSKSDLNFEVDLVGGDVSIRILAPIHGEQLRSDQFPFNVRGEFNASSISTANVYYRKDGEGGGRFLGAISKIQDGAVDFIWENYPGNGKYVLYMEAIDSFNRIIKTPEITIDVL